MAVPTAAMVARAATFVFKGSNSEHTLASFRFQPKLEAQKGRDGEDSNKRGRSGQDLIVSVPVVHL